MCRKTGRRHFLSHIDPAIECGASWKNFGSKDAHKLRLGRLRKPADLLCRPAACRALQASDVPRAEQHQTADRPGDWHPKAPWACRVFSAHYSWTQCTRLSADLLSRHSDGERREWVFPYHLSRQRV